MQDYHKLHVWERAHAFAVEIVDGNIDPLSARERIRATGPTVPYRRPD